MVRFVHPTKQEPGFMEYDASGLMSALTLRVRISGLYKFWLRRKIAMLFMRFGVWILGCGLEVEEDQSDGVKGG